MPGVDIFSEKYVMTAPYVDMFVEKKFDDNIELIKFVEAMSQIIHN